jgi:hypothetical protein
MSNPWGTSILEAQRKDLWVVDFSQVASGIGLPFQSAYDLSPQARQIILPSESIESDTFNIFNRQVKFPTFLSAIPSVRCTFLVSYSSEGSPSLINFLKTWKEKVMVGQNNLVTSNENIPLLSPIWTSNRFKFNVIVQFIQGAVPGSGDLDLQNAVDPQFTRGVVTVNKGHSWTLVNAYISSLQGPDASQTDGSSLAEIQIDLNCDAVIPVE